MLLKRVGEGTRRGRDLEENGKKEEGKRNQEKRNTYNSVVML